MDSKTIFFSSFGANYGGGQSLIARKIMGHLSRNGHTVYHLTKWMQGNRIKVSEIMDETMGPNAYFLGTKAHPSHYDVLPSYIHEYKPDELISYSDVWDMHQIAEFREKMRAKFRWTANLCFDTENIVDIWNPIVLEPDIPWVATRFVESALKNDFPWVKHWYSTIGTDVNVFKPVSEERKIELRIKHGVPPDQPLLVCVAMNQIRKKLDKIMDALSYLRLKYRMKPNIFMVSEPSSKMGWDLPILARNLGITDQVYYPNHMVNQGMWRWVPTAEMAEYYQMADAFILLTGGGGFELPLIEAMSCGLPIITTDYCTGREFCYTVREDGSKVADTGYPVPFAGIERHAQGGLWTLADIPSAAEAVKHVLSNPDEARQVGLRARDKCVAKYNWESILPDWDKLLESDTRYDNRNILKPRATRI